MGARTAGLGCLAALALAAGACSEGRPAGTDASADLAPSDLGPEAVVEVGAPVTDAADAADAPLVADATDARDATDATDGQVVPADAGPPGPAPRWDWLTPLPQGEEVRRIFVYQGALYAFTQSWTLWRSDDDGATWTVWSAISGQLRSAYPGLGTDMSVGPDGTFWGVGQNVTMARSTDGARTFEAVAIPGLYGDFAGVAAVSADVVVAGGHNLGLQRSADRGATFTRISPPTAPDPSAIWTDGTTLFVGTEYGDLNTSIDGGLTMLGGGALPPTAAVNGFAALGSERFAVGADGVLVSPDAGVTWTTASLPAGFRDDLLAVATAQGDVWAVGTTGAVLRRAAGQQSFALVAAPDTVALTAAATAPGGSLIAAGLNGELLRGSAGALTTIAPANDFNVTDVLFVSPGHLVATGSNGTLLRSADGGQTFTVTRPTTKAIYGLAAGAPGELYIAGAALLLRSTDGGDTFAPLAGFAPSSVTLPSIWADAAGDVIIHEQLDDALLVSSNHGQTFASRRLSDVSGGNGGGVWADGQGTLWAGGAYALYKSIDAGTTWTAAYQESDAVLAVWGTGPDDIYFAGHPGDIGHSTDGGKTWTSQLQPAGPAAYGALTSVWASGPDDVYVVGTSGLVLHSVDRGATWLREDATVAAGLSAISGSSAGEVVVGSAGGGILRRRP
jgi:photosystem II stability/assembly factor-like uncharacterized protein